MEFSAEGLAASDAVVEEMPEDRPSAGGLETLPPPAGPAIGTGAGGPAGRAAQAEANAVPIGQIAQVTQEKAGRFLPGVLRGLGGERRPVPAAVVADDEGDADQEGQQHGGRGTDQRRVTPEPAAATDGRRGPRSRLAGPLVGAAGQGTRHQPASRQLVEGLDGGGGQGLPGGAQFGLAPGAAVAGTQVGGATASLAEVAVEESGEDPVIQVVRVEVVGGGIHGHLLGRSPGPSGSRNWSAIAARPRAMRERTVPSGDIEDLGDLGVVEVTQIAQHHGGPELRAELRQRGVDVEAGDHRRLHRRRPGRLPAAAAPSRPVVGKLGRLRPAFPAAQFVESGIGGDPVEPGGEQ